MLLKSSTSLYRCDKQGCREYLSRLPKGTQLERGAGIGPQAACLGAGGPDHRPRRGLMQSHACTRINCRELLEDRGCALLVFAAAAHT